MTKVFYVIVALYGICCSGTCKDHSLENKVHLGQTDATTSINASKENSRIYYKTSTSKVTTTYSKTTTQNNQQLSFSKASLKNGQSSISSKIIQKYFGNTGSALSKLSLAASGSVSSAAVYAGSSNRADSAHFYGGSTLGHSITQSLLSALPTPSSVMPMTVESYGPITSLYHARESKAPRGVTSVFPTGTVITVDERTSESSLSNSVVSSNQTVITNSANFATISLRSLHSSRNSSSSFPKLTSSLQSHSNLSISSKSSMVAVTENASSFSSFMTLLDISSIDTSASLSSTWELNVSASVVSNQSDIKPIARKGCYVILDGLAKAMGQMTVCLIEHLRPIEVCAKCTKFHSNLRKFENLIYNTKNCEKELILDYNAQYQAVRKMYKVQYDMWQDFECEKCYKGRSDTNPSAPWVPREEFLRSEALIKDIMVCFANYSQSEIVLPYPVMLNMSNDINRTSTNAARMICTKCRNIYEKLKSYMRSIHIEGSAEKRWCADMVYGFNETRRVWGEFCITHNEDRESIIALTCFFCFLPVVFYIGTKLHSDVKERKNGKKS